MKKLMFLIIISLLGTALHRTGYTLEGGYKDGLYIQTDEGDYLLKTRFFLQTQHQFLSLQGQGKTNGFQVRRARVLFLGNAFNPQLTYQFELEMASGTTSVVSKGAATTGPNLLDGYVNYDFNNGLEVKAGQFKVPFNMDELTPDTKEQFIDKSISNDVFRFGRDTGVNLHGRIFEKYNFLGDHGYTTSDPTDSQEPQLMTAVAANFNRGGTVAGPDQSLIATTADVVFRFHGFSSLSAGYYFRNQTATTSTYGFLEQAGYFLIPKQLEVVARGTGVLPGAGVTKGYEAGGGLNYYFRGHNLKLLTDYAVLINSPLVLGLAGAAGTNGPTNIALTGAVPGFVQGQNDHRVRTQLQVFF
ncbi:MAG: hypothetical protein HY073_04805 [Deltaproteobacteria bacterium]|nr:hypothetical protein [Deltaproteobacteria bacterium]